MGGGAKQTNLQFQFTGLIRGPTVKMGDGKLSDGISIHRPHTRPDFLLDCPLCSFQNFNSQASYEARPQTLDTSARLSLISIHRPHTRPDFEQSHCCSRNGNYFNSQASYEARRPVITRSDTLTLFQFTGLIRGPTYSGKEQDGRLEVFQFTGLIRGPTALPYVL